MILDHRHFTLAGRHTFERFRARGPYRARVAMPDEACFYYLVTGRARTFGPQNSVASQEGIALKCGNYLTDFLSAPELDFFEVITIHFSRELLREVFATDYPALLEEIDRHEVTAVRRFDSSELFGAYIKGLEFYFEHPELVSDELQRLKIREIILLLARTDQADRVRNLIEGLFQPAAADFREVIEANLFNPVGLEELAFLTGRSLSSFKREFRARYGAPPATYLRRRRLERACQLLGRTDLRITDVAYDTGFRDAAAFSKVFRRAYGKSPRDYREGVL